MDLRSSLTVSGQGSNRGLSRLSFSLSSGAFWVSGTRSISHRLEPPEGASAALIAGSASRRVCGAGGEGRGRGGGGGGSAVGLRTQEPQVPPRGSPRRAAEPWAQPRRHAAPSPRARRAGTAGQRDSSGEEARHRACLGAFSGTRPPLQPREGCDTSGKQHPALRPDSRLGRPPRTHT